MKKIILILLISYIITDPVIDDFKTQAYYDFDWTDDDENKFKLEFNETPSSNLKVVLLNGTKICTTNCTSDNNAFDCTLTGNECQADKDNPGHKFYYAVYYNTNDTDINVTGGNGISAGVTISVCSGYYLKYSMALLSLILFLS